jgi:hypothetical protein
MNSKYFLLILSSTIILIHSDKIEGRPDKSAIKTCLIQNIEYRDEYLYSCFKLDAADDFKRKVYTNPIETAYMRSFTQLKWKFEPVVEDDYSQLKDKNQTYYFISNSHYKDEYLCSSSNHFDQFSYRRKVNLKKMMIDTSKNDKKCMWRLEEQSQSDSHQNRYIIWNVYYNEPIYAAMDLLSEAKSNRRNVYTWYKNPDSKQFVWNLICL